MNVNKKVLEKMSNQELEKYIKFDSQFQSQAVFYAFEILESRGREFTEAETEKVNFLQKKKFKDEEIIVHPNHLKSSDLLYISAGLGVLNTLLSVEILDSFIAIVTVIITLAFLFLLGYLARQGYDWFKYVLLSMLVLGIFGIPQLLQNIMNKPISGTISIVITLIQFWAMRLLFKIPKRKNI